ncbi:hypothetical protein GWK47_039687 [Chionoecetes opilio]|uniref:Uncharacterized protein n=1 Tax=Chionoecetes opilio TaxID=41210 RepID=A0A8J4YQS9_CHIOP|nr:hypothetical protein GWK47_039687 [Chionoecetes opilio]
MDYRELVIKLSSFPRWCPLPRWKEFDSCPGAMHQARMDVKSPLLIQDLDVRRPVPLAKEERGPSSGLCRFFVPSLRKGLGLSFFPVQALDSPRTHPSLGTYDKIDTEIGDVALSNCSSHLWYVSEEPGWAVLFDSDLSLMRDQKRQVRPYDERNLTERTRLEKSHASKGIGPRSPPGRLRQGVLPLLPESLHLD